MACFPGGSAEKNLPANVRDEGDLNSIPGSARSPGGGNGNPFQYPCLKNSTDRGAWGLQSTGLQRAGHERAPERAHSHVNTPVSLTHGEASSSLFFSHQILSDSL